MEAIMRAVCANFDCKLTEFNGEDSNVYVLVNFPPTVALSKLVNSLNNPPADCGRSSPASCPTTTEPIGSDLERAHPRPPSVTSRRRRPSLAAPS
ncbi:transposase [Micromonospora sp. IBHARD004]|uniref:transposase n=1 Tax=Micromonospora sp. IBHARD004 TaxID=3457764 RepID=UPI004059ED1A